MINPTPQEKPNRKKYDFSDLAGKLILQGDPVEIQTRMLVTADAQLQNLPTLDTLDFE